MNTNKPIKKLEENRERVKSIFNRDGVIIAYLFGSGSHKGKETGPLSDLDFAIKLKNYTSKTKRQELYLSILSDLISFLGDNIDLVLINDARILLQFNIIKTGEILFKRSEKEKVKLESRIIQKYLDTKYYLQRHVDQKISKFAKKGFK